MGKVEEEHLCLVVMQPGLCKVSRPWDYFEGILCGHK